MSGTKSATRYWRWSSSSSSIIHYPSSIIHHPLSIIHQPSPINHQPSSITHHTSTTNLHPSSIIHHPSSIIITANIWKLVSRSLADYVLGYKAKRYATCYLAPLFTDPQQTRRGQNIGVVANLYINVSSVSYTALTPEWARRDERTHDN